MAHTLLLIRHAKAVGEASSDADRPLSPRGLRDAQVAGGWLADHDLVPDLVLVSPALRARQTWKAISSRLGADADAAISIDARIYDNTLESLLDVLNDVNDDQQCVAVVGHNPSMHALAATLADGSDADNNDEIARLGESFPTAAIAVFDTDGDWSQFPPDDVTPRLFVVPRS